MTKTTTTMKSILAIAATLAASAAPVNAFVTPRPSAFLGANVMEVPSTAMSIDSTTRTYSKLLPIDDTGEMESSSSWRKHALGKIKSKAMVVWERMDTLKSAGFYEDGELAPLQAGFKRNVALLVAAFLFKWYRARYITKVRSSSESI